jgi:hypothetical protein
VDESSQQHRYLVIGGIILPQPRTATFVAAVWENRRPELPSGEMKWTKVSAAKLSAYKRIVDLFFSQAFQHGPHFHAVVVDTSRQKHHVFNQGSPEVGFNKEVYQLCMKLGRQYRTILHIYLDNRTTKSKTDELRLILNRGIKKAGDTRDWPYRRVMFRDSKSVELIQLADIFSGAIAFRLNGHHAVHGASSAKIELSSHILSRAGVSDVSKDTARTGRFTIWHRQLR